MVDHTLDGITRTKVIENDKTSTLIRRIIFTICWWAFWFGIGLSLMWVSFQLGIAVGRGSLPWPW